MRRRRGRRRRNVAEYYDKPKLHAKLNVTIKKNFTLNEHTQYLDITRLLVGQNRRELGAVRQVHLLQHTSVPSGLLSTARPAL